MHYQRTQTVFKKEEYDTLRLREVHKERLKNTVKLERQIVKPESLTEAGQIWFNPIDESEMLWIPSGEFMFGVDMKEYGDSRRMVYTEGFWIDRYPVTNGQYQKFLKENPKIQVPLVDEKWAHDYNWDPIDRVFPKGKAKYPVALANWDEAQSYCKWSKKRLPSEYEWEKAARGLNGLLYPWGNIWHKNRCNTRELGRNETTKVTLFQKWCSPFGCVDMVGNVWEWTSSKYEYRGYVIRGGSWQTRKEYVGCWARSGLQPHYRSSALGFRGISVS